MMKMLFDLILEKSHLISYVATTGLFIVVVKQWFQKRQLKSEVNKLMNKSWTNVVNLKSRKTIEATLNSIDSLAICQIDRNDNITFSNAEFNQIFGKHTNWEEFFKTNFKSDKSLRGVANIYKFVNDVRNDFFINLSSRNEKGIRFVMIHKIDSIALKKIADSRNNLLEKNKSNAYDLLEDSINKFNNFKSTSQLKLSANDFAESLCVYVPEELAQNVLDHYVRSVVAIARSKSFNSEIEIKTTRDDKRFYVTSYIPDINLNAQDMVKQIPFAGRSVEIGNVLKQMNQMLEGYDVNLMLKNVESATKTGLHIELAICDLENVSIKSFEYNL